MEVTRFVMLEVWSIKGRPTQMRVAAALTCSLHVAEIGFPPAVWLPQLGNIGYAISTNRYRGDPLRSTSNASLISLIAWTSVIGAIL